MNSLEQLNQFSSNGIPYEDSRAYSISFDATSPVNQSVATIEGQVWVSPVGINITELLSTPGDMYYTIDLSGITLPINFSWQNHPLGLTSEVIATGIYQMRGIISTENWELIKNPLIQIYDQGTNFSYPVSITYPNPSNVSTTLTKTWTVSVNVTNTLEITTPGNWTYIKNSPGTINNTPEIVDTTQDATYTITVTPSNTSFVSYMSTTGSGGSSSYNNISKVLTITGTKPQINSHLSHIILTTANNVVGSFTLTYSMTNHISGLVTSVQQSLVGSAEGYAIGVGTFSEDVPFDLDFSIVDNSATATTYSFSIAQQIPNSSTQPGFFIVNGSNVGTSWSISDTRSNINIANVWYSPPGDYAGDLTFYVNLSKVDNGNTVIQAQNDPVLIINGASNPEIVNMIARSYVSHQTNNIFSSSTPYINDGSDVGQTYTITLSSTVGQFGSNVSNAISSNTYTFVGNLTQVNNQFNSLVFVPRPGPAANGTFTYTQARNGVNQVNSTLAMTGLTGSLVSQTYSFTTGGNITFTEQQALYGNIQILSVAGGEGGGDTYSGGGGQARLINASRNGQDPVSSGTYSITIGTGGPNIGSSRSGGNTYATKNSVIQFSSLGGGQGGVRTSKNSWDNGELTGSFNTGGNGVTYQPYPLSNSLLYGGGGGTGDGNQNTVGDGNGGNATLTPLITGAGGNGLYSDISGSLQTYGWGAAGGYNLSASNVAVPAIGSSQSGGRPGINNPVTNRGGGGGGRLYMAGAGGYTTNAQSGAAGIMIIKIT